jgi:hypothetical protein
MEPQANGPLDAPAAEASDRAPAPSPADALLQPGPPSDDSPTIISKRPPLNLPADDALAGVVRGRRLAHFELLAPIGVGGMAAVLRARDTQLDRSVALKILPPEMAAEPENIRRFQHEARAAAKLDHENIARAFFCGEDQGLHFIAFEFVEGENLRALLDRRGRLPVGEALQYLLQIATGLAHAAARGVVHRDVKPSNIIITPGGRAKLVDMGLARSLHHDHGLTASGVTLGTFDYISPEQALEPRDADSRSDIYSLGCTAYHMLTGQPPVPDGTAAKKLSHHQHVAPLDPRQLNPAIPDEVAALLSRMMAKDPKDRHQHPDELVQHLHYLVEQCGHGAERSGAGAYVERPASPSPRSRPLLLAGIGVVALLLVVLLLGPASGPDRPTGGQRVENRAPEPGTRIHEAGPNGDGQEAKSEAPRVASSQADARPGPAEPKRTPVVQTVRTLAELAAVLEKAPGGVVQLADDVTLTSRDDALTITGDVLLRGEGGRRPVIKLAYDASAGGDPWAALLVKGGHVRLQGLRFEVDAKEAPGLDMTAVALHGGRLTVEDCEFVQRQPPAVGQGSLSAIAVTATPLDGLRVLDLGSRGARSSFSPRTPPAGGDRPTLVLQGCVFAGGQRALNLAGAANVHVSHCAFGPHAGAVVHLLGDPRQPAELAMSHCSVHVGDGAVFRFQDGAGGRLDVGESIFSGVRAATLNVLELAGTASGVLIQQTGNPSPLAAVSYTGRGNVYHNLRAYWQAGSRPDATRFGEFRRLVVRDDRSAELSASPWQAADPLAALQKNDYRLAFQAHPDRPQLRTGTDGTRSIGVQRGFWGEYAALPRLPEERKPAEATVRREKVVDPSAAQSGDGTYRTLAGALSDAVPGDVILLMHNGLLAVDTLRLEKPAFDVTIRPYPNYRPVLTLGETPDQEASLFRLYDGKLRLEGLHFQFPTPRQGFRSQAVLAVAGDGQCVFKDCLVTLQEAPTVQFALVALLDPAATMRMGGPARPQGPSVKVEGCFVRGAGDLVSVRASRPFELSVEDSLLSLEGSLLVVDGTTRDLASPPSSQVQLRKVTAYLTDHLVWLRAAADEARMGRSGLVPTQLSLEHSLFAAAAGKSLVHLDGVDTVGDMQRLFRWGGGSRNTYSNFTRMLDQRPREPEMMSVPPYDQAAWETMTREAEGRFERVRFAAAPREGEHARATPADFRVQAELGLQDCGADLDRLPRPVEDTIGED